ncbi:hypothetical protein FE257_009176 [Aspergillus nanangensis]|uniref:Ent-kaurene synthase n=1 Tax=Aspergillus nanangensis TaxID=2582783 RepID=A0AAD4CKL8_ASPNN|nr:hypothetical protein FE257_009176 [Aspergillus nanangensis]
MAPIDSLQSQARALMQYVAQAEGKTHAFGTLTSSLYDTAWVALVRKPDDNTTLLFPECFQYVLDTQLPSGGWECCHFEIDGIMNTLGGLLALKKNSDIHSQFTEQDIDSRIERAVGYLNKKFETWDVGSCDYVGFEILVPAMLSFLGKEGLSFDFPGYRLLMELNEKKLARIPPSVWSGKIQTTITHSLEAFAGTMDFTGLADQLVFGAMGSSPSSTAAYLMYTPGWNEDAERYLRDLVAERQKEGFGGVPGMYPTTGFEVLWIACTLLDNGFELGDLEGFKSMIQITDEFYESLGDLVSGFSRMSVGDADDTARSIFIRCLLGKPTTPERLIKKFEGPDHFLTYMFERHPSVTTNCNCLTAILESPDVAPYGSQIEKLTRYICASWSNPDLVFADKWNVSEFYPIMLMCDSLIRLLLHWDQGHLPEISEDLIREKVTLVLWQALMQTLQKQNRNGSWGERPSREITAYAIIALSNLASLPLVPQIRDQVDSAIEQGRTYIRTATDVPEVEYIWIAKTTYSPLRISKAYILAGLQAKNPKYSMTDRVMEVFDIPERALERSISMFTSFATLKGFPAWQVLGSLIEAHFFLGRLEKVHTAMFDREGMKKDNYLAFIPMTVCCANNLQRSFIKADILHDLMVLILRIYQLDEYMEHVVAKNFESSLQNIKDIIREIFRPAAGFRRNVKRVIGSTKESIIVPGELKNGQHSNGDSEPNLVHKSAMTTDLSALKGRFQQLVESIIDHPPVLRASPYDQHQLQRELRECLLSHLIQIDDSRQASQPDKGSKELQWLPQSSYHSWLHTVGASHSCAPLSLAYLLCLLPTEQRRGLSAEELYTVQDICMHLSNKARLENDRGSYARDQMENNLNSLDFPEFGAATDRKSQLGQIIGYERKCCRLGLDTLRELKARGKSSDCGDVLGLLEFYFFLTDIYNDVYIMKDISCRA